MVMDRIELDAMVMADKVLRRAGGMGIHEAGFSVLDGEVSYNGEVVEAPAPKPRPVPAPEPVKAK